MRRVIFGDNVTVYDKTAVVNHIQANGKNDVELSQSGKACCLHDVGKVLQNVNALKECFPKAEICYGVSSNPDPTLIKLLNHCNVNFCASTGPEIEKLTDLGIKPESIIYSGLCKMNRHIKIAGSSKVRLLTFGTLLELKRIIKIYPDASLILRFKADRKEKSNLMIDLCAQDDDQLHNIFQAAKESNANIQGLQFDFSENVDEPNFSACVNSVIQMSEKYGFPVKYLSIGSQSFYQAKYACLEIYSKWLATFKNLNPSIQLIVEPTSFFTRSAVELYCTVSGLRSVRNEETDTEEIFYYLNDGLYGSLSNVLYHDYQPVPVLVKNGDACTPDPVKNVFFWGPTCDSMDKICHVNEFPRLKIGDVVYFSDVGAFCGACATTFNGFDIAKNLCVISFEDNASLEISEDNNGIFHSLDDGPVSCSEFATD